MRKVFLSIFIVLSAAVSATAAEFSTDKIADVAIQVTTLGGQYGVPNVLVVFDLDDTLLAPNQDLGSTAWFEWQQGLAHSGRTEGLAGGSYPGFWEFVAKLNTLSGMHTLEKGTASVVGEIQKKGYRAIVLTGRGPDVRSQTENALLKSKLDFRGSAFGPGFPGEFLPVTAQDSGGLSPSEIESLDVRKPRPVSYMNGVMMVSGQHKGAMLRVLLHKTASPFRAIVFVDDQLKNIAAVQKAFKDQCVEVATFHYTADRPQLDQFEKGNKQKVIDDVNKLNQVLKEVFPAQGR